MPPSNVTALKRNLDAAVSRLETANEVYTKHATPANLESFDDAEAAVDGLRESYERAKRIEKARGRSSIRPTDTAGSDMRVSSEPLTYEQHNGRSFFSDVYARERGDFGALERLGKHMEEISVERDGRRDGEQFALSSTDNQGGYLVPPLWLLEDYANFARAGRVTVDAIGARPLPPNTDSINLPLISSGTSTAFQNDLGAVSNTDAVFGTTSADVKTIAGMQDVSQQLVDRAQPAVDEVIFQDLVAAYNTLLDNAVINNAVANALGLLAIPGSNTVTYTDASPTLPELYSKVADAVQRISTSIFQAPTAIVMHPRRWAWCLTALDTANRPLIVPTTQAPLNAAATAGDVVAQGPVGTLQGIAVYTDPSIPTNLGGSTTEDRILVLHTPSLRIWEDQSGPRLDVFRDVLSSTLAVRLRLFNYVAFAFARRPTAITVIVGTGLVVPAF